MKIKFYGTGAVLLALCFGVGCGGTVVEDSGVAGTGGSGGVAGTGGSGGVAGTGGSGGVAGTGGSGGVAGTGGSGGQDACAEHLDEDGVGAVTIRFVNQSGLPIYLPALCGNPIFDMRPTNGADGVDYAFDTFCLQTCEDLQTSGIIDCAMCEPSSILLPPDGTYDVVWDGTGLESTNMPAACWATPQSYEACGNVVAAQPQKYRIQAMGYASCGDGEPCACDATGYCAGEAGGLEAWANLLDFNYAPGAMLVEVVFGGCAFPCP